MTSQRNFYLLGVLFLMLLGVIAFFRIATDSLSYLEILMYGTAAFICFARGYIYPQFKHKDERANFIKQKGMKISFTALLTYLVVILYGTYLNVITLSVFEIVSTLIALTLLTLFSSWVILVKKY
ncbi:hypothetical protein [Bacillus tequilensis]|uniref:Permease n=1 Tax=Bacillus tequilensis TaxID=227866 RepID=A0A6H0WKD8_9BACI|nr:hypothetical protein [Bacillus tequilensis]QIW79987.1 hypothetical protein G4P54_09300 [Bacillus tequilensis]